MNIVLSPHFDDAVLSLGGLLTKEGEDTLVATIFAGTPQIPISCRWDKICGFSDSTQAIKKRAEENRLSLNFLGVSDDRIRNYKNLDAEYRFAMDEKMSMEPELTASIENGISSLLLEFASEPIKIFAPGIELNTDHSIVKNATIAVIKELPRDSMHKLFFYQDIPYAFNILEKKSIGSLLGLFSQKNTASRNYRLLEREIMKSSLHISACAIPLTAADMDKKLYGIALHESQVPHIGKSLLEKIEQFSAAQSKYLSIPEPYCEAVYAWSF
jgi:LmbE family N-acetylglucosaminyl deacetylase